MTVPTSSPTQSFRSVFGGTRRASTDAQARLRITIPALTTVVLRAEQTLPPAPTAVPMDLGIVKLDGTVTALRAMPRTALRDPSSVTFALQRCSSCTWETLARDDAAPFTVVLPTTLPAGARIVAITRSSSGAVAVGGTHVITP